MKNVLVASDLMPRSDVAFRRAMILAGEANATVHLVHVVEDPDPAREGEAADRLRAAAASAPKPSNVEHGVRTGEPHAEIIAAASECAADLIVMGAHEKRLSRIFVGTTVERVMRSGDRPLLMVNVEPSGPYQRMLLPVDMSQASANAIRAAQHLRLLNGPDVFVVHAFEALAKATMHQAGVEPHSIARHVEASAHEARKGLASFLARSDIATVDYETILEEGPPFLGIKKAAERIVPDLIVIGTHGRTGLKRALIGSVADEVLRRAECDVLAVPPAANRLFGGQS